MKRSHYVFALIILAGTTLYAQRGSEQQGSVRALGGSSSPRASARVLYSNRADNSFPGQLAIHYGQPQWRSEYEDPTTFDQMTQGRVWRMGNDFWTVLDTNLPLRIAGKDIAVGAYYLGVHRSEDGGTWSLAFMDPTKIRQAHLDSEIPKRPSTLWYPWIAEETTDKLDISMAAQRDAVENVTIKVVWGTLQLIAKATIDFMVPMTFSIAEETTDKLDISMAAQRDAVENVTIKVVWGTLGATN